MPPASNSTRAGMLALAAGAAALNSVITVERDRPAGTRAPSVPLGLGAVLGAVGGTLLGLALGAPVYVTHINAETNTITVGPREDLLKQTSTARQLNMIKYPDLRDERTAVAKIRYKDDGAPALVQQVDDDVLSVSFAEPRRAITPGQSVVLYEGEDVLAGGWIHTVETPHAATTVGGDAAHDDA